MKIKLAVMASAAICFALPASAQVQNQQTLRDSSVSLYNVCLYSAGELGTDAACACTAGFIGGVLTEREFDIAARLGRIAVLSETGASDAEIQAEVNNYFAAGYTEADADYVNAKISAAANRGDAICAPYSSIGSS